MSDAIYELSEDAERVLQKLEASTSVTKEALLSEAISLLDVFVAAIQDGKQVIIADKSYKPISIIQLNRV